MTLYDCLWYWGRYDRYTPLVPSVNRTYAFKCSGFALKRRLTKLIYQLEQREIRSDNITCQILHTLDRSLGYLSNMWMQYWSEMYKNIQLHLVIVVGVCWRISSMLIMHPKVTLTDAQALSIVLPSLLSFYDQLHTARKMYVCIISSRIPRSIWTRYKWLRGKC